MKRIFTFICAALMLLLASCGGDNTVQGYVVGKQHTPRRITTHYNAVLHQSQTRIIPERWILYVADSTAVRNVCVDRETFDNAVKGETIRLRYGKENGID